MVEKINTIQLRQGTCMNFMNNEGTTPIIVKENKTATNICEWIN